MFDNSGTDLLCGIKEGDVVARNSYNRDIYFKVISFYTGSDGNKYARLKGLDFRLEATSPVDDLVKVKSLEVCLYLDKRQVEYMENMKNACICRDENRRRSYERAMSE
ncbi:MAG: sporulation peptidase YabG [Bacillota bacterium]